MSLSDSSPRLELPLGPCTGSSGPALRTVSSSGAMPRALSMERTTSARAALRDRFAVSLPLASAWPEIIAWTEKPRRLRHAHQLAELVGNGIHVWRPAPRAGLSALESNLIICPCMASRRRTNSGSWTSVSALKSTLGEPAGSAATSIFARSTQYCGALPRHLHRAAIHRQGDRGRQIQTGGKTPDNDRWVQRLVRLPVTDDAFRTQPRLRQHHGGIGGQGIAQAGNLPFSVAEFGAGNHDARLLTQSLDIRVDASSVNCPLNHPRAGDKQQRQGYAPQPG